MIVARRVLPTAVLCCALLSACAAESGTGSPATATSGVISSPAVTDAPGTGIAESTVTFHLTAAPHHGAVVNGAALDTSLRVLTGRFGAIPGAQLSLDGTDGITVVVPSSAADRAAELMQPGMITFRPVVAAVPSATAGPATPLPAQPASGDGAAWRTAAATELAAQSCVELPAGTADDPERPLLACDRTGELVYLLDPAAVDGASLETASAADDPTTGNWTVTVVLDSAGTQTWTDYTAANINVQVAFVVDSAVLIAPVISTPIDGAETVVNGNFTKDEAVALADSLQYGSLPLPFTVTREN